MPTYDYECSACGHVFETMHGMTAPVLRKCPKCKKLKLRRLISGGAGVIFEGSGFYETDYKRNRRGGDSAYQADKKRDEAGGSDTKGETKPDAKADTTSKPDSKSDVKAKKDDASGKESASKKDSGAKKKD